MERYEQTKCSFVIGYDINRVGRMNDIFLLFEPFVVENLTSSFSC